MATPIPFNATWYLSQNPDVAAAVEAGLIDAETHFQQFGRFEGRSASFLLDVEYYLANNPDVAEAVRAGQISAWDHALQHGVAEGRLMTPVFDEAFYLQSNPDVAQAVADGLLVSGLQHFVLAGHTEARAINPMLDMGKYAAANPDVAQAVAQGLLDPLAHLMVHGIAEGRNLGNGIQLPVFDNDPLFTGALGASNHMDAWMRVQMVAPFVPTFERPAGWTPPASTPIPVDFVPPQGSGFKLVVPSDVPVPSGVTLSDQVFLIGVQPVPTPAPVVPGGGGGGSPGSAPLPFDVTQGGAGVWTLPSANGNVGMTKNGENYVLTPANGAPLTIPANNLNTLVVPNAISLSGAADVLKTGPSITGAVTVNDVVSLADVNTIAGKTNGVVTATLADGGLASFSGLTDTSPSSNNYTINLNDPATDGASLSATDLKTLGGKTTGPVTVLNAVPIGGSFEDIVAALVIPETKVLAPRSPVTIADTNATLSAATLSAIGGATTGVVTVPDAATIAGTAAEVKAALLNEATLVVTNGAKVTISDTISLADANAIAAKTNGIVTATLEAGSLASFNDGTSGIESGNAYTFTVNDPDGSTLSASDLSTLGGKTSGEVKVTNAVSITGSASELTAALVTANTKVNAPNAVLTIGDAAGSALSATALSALGGATSGAVNVTNAVVISGTVSEVTAALVTPETRVLAPTAVVTITDVVDAAVSAADLAAIGTTTTGTVTVSNAVVISGSTAEVKAALVEADTLVVAATAKVTVTDTISVADANLIAAKTSGAVTATVTTGNLASFADLAETDNVYTITVNDMAGTVLSAVALSTLGGKTKGTVTVSNAVVITDSATRIKAALVDENTRVVARNAEVTITGTVSVTDANAVDAVVDSAVTATLAPGNLAGFSGLTGTNNAYTITVSDNDGAVLQASDLKTLGGKTTGTVTVSKAVEISGTAADVTAALVTENTAVVAATAKVRIVESSAVNSGDLASIHSATTGTVTIEGTSSNDDYSFTDFAAGDLIIKGNEGADTIVGGRGNDVLLGGDGNDSIAGGDGADTITGGAENDILTGGAGADVFVYTVGDGLDTFKDFVSGADKYDTNFATASNNFTFAAETTRKIGTNDGLIFDTSTYGVFEVVDKFTGNNDTTLDIANFGDATDVMIAIDWDQRIATTGWGDDFLLLVRDTNSSNSYLYHADNDVSSEYFDPTRGETGDTLTLVAVFENTNLAGGDII